MVRDIWSIHGLFYKTGSNMKNYPNSPIVNHIISIIIKKKPRTKYNLKDQYRIKNETHVFINFWKLNFKTHCGKESQQ